MYLSFDKSLFLINVFKTLSAKFVAYDFLIEAFHVYNCCFFLYIPEKSV